MNKIAINTLIVVILLIGFVPDSSFAKSYDPVSVPNLNIELKGIDGSSVSTKSNGKARILFFFNTECSHCRTIEESLQQNGFNTNEVDIIMAESSSYATYDEVVEFYANCGLEDISFCYDAKTECWDYLRACGYTASATIKPVIIYIDENNIIRGYSTAGVDIYSEAKKYGIYMEKHDHNWINVTTAPGFCVDGESHKECTICGKIKESAVITGLGPTVIKLKNIKKSKKAVTVKWKKPSRKALKKISGYQIAYSKKPDMSEARCVVVKNKKATGKTIRKLQSKKKYYFVIRSYKTSNGKNYYSDWSKIKSVIVK